MTSYRVALIPGDGIGAEVLPPAQQVLDTVGRRHGFGFTYTPYDWSCRRYAREGAMMPEDGLDQLRDKDAILLGAVGYPGVPDHISLWGLLIPIRRGFRQYVNLRPIRVFDGVDSPLRTAAAGEVDFVVVRENVEGEYSEIGGRLNRGFPDEMAVQQAVFTRAGVTRVLDYTFELAATRRGRVTSATKSNGIVHTLPFWDELVAERGAAHPRITWDSEHIDALAAKFVLDPARFDVVVASNLFGDILSDLAAAVAGSIGIAPAANLNPEREFPSMFEPVHGSAPDIAGRGIANPLGAFADARAVARVAAAAEQAGWDGLFVWDHVVHDKRERRGQPFGDPWMLLTAAALATSRLRLGTLVTPVARRRPEQLARQVATLDSLSGGRVIFGAGLGGPIEDEFGSFGETTDPVVLAERLDEGLELLDRYWSGEPVNHHGRHYQVRDVTLLPASVQRPRPPVWVGGFWPHRRPMLRAARWDGAVPLFTAARHGHPPPVDQVRDLVAYVHRHRESDTPFEIVVGGVSPGDDPAKARDLIAPMADVGATWWDERQLQTSADLDRLAPVLRRVDHGPPAL